MITKVVAIGQYTVTRLFMNDLEASLLWSIGRMVASHEIKCNIIIFVALIVIALCQLINKYCLYHCCCTGVSKGLVKCVVLYCVKNLCTSVWEYVKLYVFCMLPFELCYHGYIFTAVIKIYSLLNVT